MKKLIFRYSAMNAGKSANLIMTYNNYKELGLHPVAVVPNDIKTKAISSRIGVSIKAISFCDLKNYLNENKVDCVLVDEAQFLKEEEINLLNMISLYLNITVICYGLRTTSTGELFEGSKRLLAIADDLEELPTLCFCGKKAKMNIRAIDGVVDKTKDIVKLKEEQAVSYISVCRKCFDLYYDPLENHKQNISHLIKRFDNTKKKRNKEN